MRKKTRIVQVVITKHGHDRFKVLWFTTNGVHSEREVAREKIDSAIPSLVTVKSEIDR